MDYIEEESRPRFLFQARPSSSNPNPNATTLPFSKLHFAACLSAALLLLFFALFSPLNETLSFLLIWTALSLLAAPFAPSSLTGGDVHVGRGDPLPDPPASDPNPPDQDESRKRRARSRKPDDRPPPIPAAVGSGSRDPVRNGKESVKEVAEEEKEWTDEDFDILKRQISKHPAGEPKRWERIAEVFKGRHGLESVIKTAKSLSEKRPAAGDSFAQFLKQRKPLDKRAEVVDGELNGGIQKESDGGSVSWSGGEDIALLNALKAFPKEVSMRWEKIAAAVPGKSKAACMKRVAELKRDFRSSKG